MLLLVDEVAHFCVVVHFCGCFPRFNPWTWKIVLGLRLDILLSDCNAACSWELQIWEKADLVLIMVKHESSNIAHLQELPSASLECSICTVSISVSSVWWLPHRWCFHPLQLGGKAVNSHFWSLPSHLYTSIAFAIFCYPLLSICFLSVSGRRHPFYMLQVILFSVHPTGRTTLSWRKVLPIVVAH